MADIPHAVLSEQFEQQLGGRRLLAAVFVTFRFDPEFFEQQVLPVFLDVPTSHAEAIRRVQLEDALRDVRTGLPCTTIRMVWMLTRSRRGWMYRECRSFTHWHLSPEERLCTR